MKWYRRIVFYFLLYFECNLIFCKSYYVDSYSGDDNNNGCSVSTPWKSFDHIPSCHFSAGDSLLLKRGSIFNEPLELNLIGDEKKIIVVASYGDQELSLPVINGNGIKNYGVLLNNSSYCKIQELEITNTGKERKANRLGVLVKAENCGESKNVTLNKLFVHDVNGSLIKADGGGGGIYWENKGEKVKSRFHGLIIKNCRIINCGRNGIYSNGYTDRDNWYPSINVRISHNLIEGVPGDGIVPIGCDGAIIEHNVMRNCPDVLSSNEAAAGIWPWSCDNTIIQYNEVSGHNAKWDGQGFDSDYNCHNTLIQYNYSHDNAGGFLLVCNDGNSLGKNWNKGTINSTIQYNISVNDGIRNYPTKQAGWFTPIFHITGPVENTKITNNLIVQCAKENDSIDMRVLKMGNWGNKWPNNTQFQNNIFYADSGVKSKFDFGEDIHTSFINNTFIGNFENCPGGTDLKISKDDIDNILKPVSVKEKISRLKKFIHGKELKYESSYPGELGLDDQGQHINAHGGGLLFYQGKYYWFGERKSSNTSLALVGVRYYSSSDLYNWKDEGVALSVEKKDTISPIAIGCTIERPKVIYNSSTNKFVMYFHLELRGQGYNAAQVRIATSDRIEGSYTFLKSLRPNADDWPISMTRKQRKSKVKPVDFGDWWTPEWRLEITDGLFVKRDYIGGQMSRDMTLFVDDNGTTYHIYSSEDNLTIHIAQLTAYYLNYTGKYMRLFPGGNNEAPAMMKYKDKYYLITSECTGWATNAVRSAVVSSFWAPWKPIGNPCVGEEAELTFDS